jgi:MFS family permease
MVLLGVGAGLAFPALMTLAMSGATPTDAGLASGLVNTTAQVGGALGLAVLATLASTRSGELSAAGEPLKAALNGGYHLAFTIGALLVAAAIVVGIVVLQSEQAVAKGAAPELAGAQAACPEAT